MWIGEPGGVSRKITAFCMGQIPEFTLLAPDGNIIIKGWRAIFERVIRIAGIKRIDIEKAFGVTLEAGEDDQTCQQCIRESGKIVKVKSKHLLCNFHLGVLRSVTQELDRRGEVKYQRKIQGKAPGESVIIPDSALG